MYNKIYISYISYISFISRLSSLMFYWDSIVQYSTINMCIFAFVTVEQ